MQKSIRFAYFCVNIHICIGYTETSDCWNVLRGVAKWKVPDKATDLGVNLKCIKLQLDFWGGELGWQIVRKGGKFSPGPPLEPRPDKSYLS